jgi:hypothetical protein
MTLIVLRKSLFIIICLLTILSTYLFAEKSPIDKLLKAKSLKCYYSEGYTGIWDDGKLIIEKGNFATSERDSAMVFDSIDFKKGTARLIGNQGSSDVIVLATPAGISFIEKTPVGYLMITTVFAYYKKGTDEFVCVYSRHVGSFSPLKLGPMPSQWHGTCKIWQ